MIPLTSGTGADQVSGGVGGQETDRTRTGAVLESMRESTGRPNSVGSDSGYSGTSSGSHPAHLEVTPGVLNPASSAQMPQEEITPAGVSNDTVSGDSNSNHGPLHGRILPVGAPSGDKLYKKTVYNTLTYHSSMSSNGTCIEADLPDSCILDGVVFPDRSSTDGAKLHNSALPNGVDRIDRAPCPAPVILINGDLDNRHPPHVTVTLDHSNQNDHVSEPPINNPQTEDGVILPDRFRRKRNHQKGSQQCKCGYHIDSPVSMATPTVNGEDSRCDGHVVVTSHRCEACSRSPSPHRADQEDTPERRARDVTIALQWLRQQMLQMKAQDKVLMRQFLELRASIHGLRGVGLTPSSVTDLTASSRPLVAAPCNSLPRLSPDNHQVAPRVHALPGDECEVEFRARTVSALPSRPRSKLQVRAFSKEFV